MEEVKNEGPEVVAWQFKQNGKWYLGSNTNDHKSNTISAGYPVRELCLLDKALTGYAVRDARIVELELLAAAISADCNDMANERNQFRAELAAAKETISRYETTAENCEAFRDALATPDPIPDHSEDVRAMVVPDRSDVHTSSQPTG